MKTNKEELFHAAVSLFKSLGDAAACENGIFRLSNSISLSNEQACLIRQLFESKELFRKFELEIDWEDGTLDLILSGAECTALKIEFNLYKGNEFTFYKNEHELFQKLSTYLIQGFKLPENYYFIEEDYRSDDTLDFPSITKLKSITAWLDFFKTIANIDKAIDNGLVLYYFIKGEGDKYAKPLELKITNIEELIHIDEIASVEDIAMLLSKDENGNLYHRDKQSFFKLALVDTLRKLIALNTSDESETVILFSNLDKIKNVYYEHYEVFIHNFSLGEFQQQIEEKGFDYAEKISSVLNDIQVRLYAIPIVLVSLGALAKVDNGYSYTFIIVGVFITALFNHWMINDQVLRLQQISETSSFTFDQLKSQGAEKLKRKEVIDNLEKIVENIKTRIADRNTKIKYYKICCWLPLIITCILFFHKEPAVIIDILTATYEYGAMYFSVIWPGVSSLW